MQVLIDEYFENEETITITGLALYLGFESRQSFYDYEENELFSYTIKRARLRVENGYEKMLHRQEGQVTGPLFALKNLGWTDRQEIKQTTILESLPDIVIKAHEKRKTEA